MINYIKQSRYVLKLICIIEITTPIAMKKIITLCLPLLMSITVSAQDTDNELVKQLIRDSFEDIWSDFKSETIEKHHTEDFLLLENGEAWNNDSIMSFHQRMLKNKTDVKRNNQLDFFRVEKKDSNIIWVAYQNHTNWTRNEKVVSRAHRLESAIAIRTKDGWKINFLHSTWVNSK